MDKVINYWKKSAGRDWITAGILYKNKRYSSCLFFCHLTLEKLLKGLVVKKTKKHAPYIHYLDKLALKSKLAFNAEHMNDLKVITTFNLGARYDSYRQSFYKKADKEYTDKYFKISHKLILWLKKQYLKK